MSRKKKQIEIYTHQGEYVTTVEGVMEAATFCKVTHPAVSQTLRGMSRTCGHYLLKEKKDV